jgi:spermidine/putrescine transport system ATP-binding protein
VSVRQVVKLFGEVAAVDGVTLEMPPGEFFSMVGPSGCGKTTTLRMIAGFERPTAGEILLDGTDMSATPPHKRDVNTVFQSYALFPHKSVEDNVSFGLKYKRVTKEDARKRVAEALALVQLTGLEKRRPTQLSGGQQQRVALARALVLSPRVLLLDEPLGALDARLRKDLQVELKTLQQTLGITFVYVTHDQEEALTMSDRVAVMNLGKVEQVGDPQKVYEDPETVFVAEFLGVSNMLTGDAGGNGTFRVGEATLRATKGATSALGTARAVIRPERVTIEHGQTTGENRLPALVERVVFVGSTLDVRVRLVTGDLIRSLVTNTGDTDYGPQGTPVTVHLDPESLRILGAGGGYQAEDLEHQVGGVGDRDTGGVERG